MHAWRALLLLSIAVAAGGALTNNVEVDARGTVYIVDRGGLGLHLLELSGAARTALGH